MTNLSKDSDLPEPSACINTDREIWRKTLDYYSPSIHVTESGAIGVDVGGTVYVRTVEEWHDYARKAIAAQTAMNRSAKTTEWIIDLQQRLMAQSAEIASECHDGWGNTMAEAACLLKMLQSEAAPPAQAIAVEATFHKITQIIDKWRAWSFSVEKDSANADLQSCVSELRSALDGVALTQSDVIYLTSYEKQSGLNRVRWAEMLIEQLPDDHDGRNSWLLNYGSSAAPSQGAKQ